MSSEDPISEEKRYDLKGSTVLIGQLYPVLRAKDGSIIDGIHRSEVDGSWRSEVLENIDSEEKKLAARLIANVHRRKVSWKERAQWINELAALYQKQGLKIHPHGSHKPNEIANKIAEVTGLHVQTIRRYLNQEFKNEPQGSGTLGKGFVSSEQAILSRIGSQHQEYGRRLIQRFKNEYAEELLKSPLFRARVLSMLPKHNGSGASIFDHSEQLVPQNLKRNAQGFLVYNKQKKDHKSFTGFTSFLSIEIGSHYDDFIEDCPQCICGTCPHAETCIERVIPDEEE